MEVNDAFFVWLIYVNPAEVNTNRTTVLINIEELTCSGSSGTVMALWGASTLIDPITLVLLQNARIYDHS